MVKLTATLLPLVLAAGISGLAVADDSQSSQEIAEFTGTLLRQYPFIFSEQEREALDVASRELRLALAALEIRSSKTDRQSAAIRRDETVTQLAGMLANIPSVIHVDLADPAVDRVARGPVALPASQGPLLLRIQAGSGPTKFVSHDYTMAISENTSAAVEIPVVRPGTTWALVSVSDMPIGQTPLMFRITSDKHPETLVSVEVVTPQPARLRVSVLSDETGKPVPAMVSLVWKKTGKAFPPSNAVRLVEQFEHIFREAIDTSIRPAMLPGRLRRDYWCIPGPFDMTLPAGPWELVIRGGVEHRPVFDTFELASGQTVEKEYTLSRWVDMRDHGWYSGDDHVHSRILNDEDARRLMTWIQAEDVHIANVARMGNITRVYFEQRGFGPEYRVQEGDYILSPGQEDPRTHGPLGHTLAMNITGPIRDTGKYYLYDWVFDAVHAQGGLTGYAHVHQGAFNVHRDMSLNIPKGKVDFAEILQVGQLGTDLYYRFLNLGFRLTASAGSDVPYAGTVGEVRVYAFVGNKPFTADAWFEAVRQGHTFVTNGPMIELMVDDAIPGDELRMPEGQQVRVRARAWGDPERSLPKRLEIVRHGDVIAAVDAKGDENSLEIDVQVPGGDGFWIAARVEGADGSFAHTNPVYVTRPPLRFWKYEAVPELIAQVRTSLEEIRKIVADAQAANAPVANLVTHQLAQQGPALLDRVTAAETIYEELEATYQQEAALRKP